MLEEQEEEESEPVVAYALLSLFLWAAPSDEQGTVPALHKRTLKRHNVK